MAASATSVNVLVVGETQQGKSSLIQQILELSGETVPNIPIGRGDVSCTTTVTEYRVSITPQLYQLVDNQGSPITGLDFQQSLALSSRDARVVPAPAAAAAAADGDGHEDTEAAVNFTFIDTPGLGDSSGRDMEHVADMVCRVAELGHLNALIYVHSVEEPYSHSSQTFFAYLQRSFATLSCAFLVVHSRFSTRNVRDFLGDNSDLAAVRRADFAKVMGDRGSTELEHFFIDSRPRARSPVAHLATRNEIYRLLIHLRSQVPLPVRGFCVLKTPQMRDVDRTVGVALRVLKTAMDGERQRRELAAAKGEHQVGMSRLEAERLGARIEALNADIQALVDGGDVAMGTKSPAKDYTFATFFQSGVYLTDRTLDFTCGHEITNHVTSSSTGSYWKDITVSGCTWKGTLASRAFRDMKGSVTFYTSSAIKNRERIGALEAAVRELETTKFGLDQMAKKEGSGGDSEASQLGRNLGHLEKLLQEVDDEVFDMARWPALKRYYTSTRALTPYDISDFTRQYDEHIADLLAS